MKTKSNSLQIVYSCFNKIIATVILFFFFVNISYSQRTIEQANNFAIEKIKNFDFNSSQENNQAVNYSVEQNPVTFTDIEGTTSAYMFKILKNNEYFGYITVNALDEFYPLVGLAYNVEWLPNRIEELKNVIAKHPKYSDRNWSFIKFIYVGGQDYLALFKNANQLLYVSFESKQIIPDNIISERIKLWEGKRQILIESTNTNKNKSATLSSSKSISGVKAYTWYRGCSTTALSMILDFWGEHGFSNLNYSSSTFPWNGPGETSGTCSSKNPIITRDLADELATAMGISNECQWNSEGNWGSTAEQQRDALLKITSNKGYNFSFEIDNNYSFTKFQNEIDSNRPVKIGYNIDGQADKGHAVCGFGYNYDGSAHLLQYYNTWDTGIHWMTAENECIKNWVTCTPPKQLPDLTPVSPSISVASVQAGSTLTTYCAENNIGYGSADANVISIHLSANDVLTPNLNGDLYLNEIQIPGVSNNSCSLIYSQPILIPSNIPAGDYYLFFSADGGEAITETSEDNNRVSLRLNITGNSTFNPPTNLTAIAGNAQASLNWLAPSSGTPTSYTVYRSTSETGTYTALTPNVTSLSFTATGLTNETTYWFKVKANYSSGSSDFSTAISAKPTSGATFNPPTNLTVSAGNGQVTVSWSKPSLGTPNSYTVYRSTSETGTYTALSPNTQSLSFTSSGLSNGTTYWFKVKANYSAGSSIYSSTISAMPTAPSILSNDEPCNADLLTVQSTYSYVTKTIVGATKSTQIPDALCDQPSNVDVWFKFTIPSGIFGIHTNSISISGNDCGMAIYTGSCSSLTQRYCIQGGNPLQTYMPWADDLNLTAYAGQTGYIRLWEFGTVCQTGNFQIGVAGGSSNGGNCTITSISPGSETHNSSSFSTTPGVDDIIVNGQPNCTYTVSESCSWLTVSPMSGTMNSNSAGTIGQAFLNYSIQANTTTSSRQCTFYINGTPVTITQNGEEADDDFYVQNVNVPSTTLGINSSVNVSCNQCYSGSKSESVLGVSTIGYYLSANASFDSNDILLATDISGLGSDDPCNLETALLTIPGNTAPGQYYILFVADHDKVYSESNENNNIVAVPISVNSASHDFYILNESVYPDRILSSGLPTIRCDLGYSGSSLDAELSNCHVGYFLSTDKNFSSTSDTYFGSYITGIGSDNPIKDLSYSQASIPAGTPPGIYYILIVADYDGRFVETNEDNNVKYFQVTVVGSSASEDFYIQNSSLSSSLVVAGGTIDVECIQSYIGTNLDVNMVSSVVGYYLSKNTTPGSINDIKLGTDGSSLGSDYPFESESATLTIPAGTPPGQYYILFVADYDNRFNESDENNNVSYLPINVTGECIAPVISLHPSAQDIKNGESANFSITASGSNNQYQWQYNAGNGWSDVPNSSPYSGVNTNTLNVSSATLGMNGYQYRCYVTSSCTTATATSNEAVLTVNESCIAPISPIEATAIQTSVVPGQSTTLQVVGGTLNSAPEWVWYTGNCDGTIAGYGSSLSVNPTETTTYFVNSSACGITTTCKSVTVNVIAEYYISTSSSPSEGGITNGGGKYERGQSCTVEATANNGYDFSYWSESETTVSTNPSYSFNVSENRTLVANFVTSSIPTITVSTTSLPDFGTVIVGQHSIPESYIIWGSFLNDNIRIIAPNGFQISKSSDSGYSNELTLFQSDGQVSPTTIYVKFSPSVYGYQLGNISHTSSNTTIKNVKVTGTGSQSCIPVTMITQPQSILVKPGNTATFNVSVNGSGPFSYYWYKDGNFLTSTKDISSPNNSYTIPVFSGAENSYYYCIITNCDSTYIVQSDNAELTMIPDEGRTFIDIDGNIYTAVTIGTQLWMGQNLKTTRYNDGTSIILNTDYGWGSSDSPAYCWYNNDISNKNPYGALYNWYSVNTGMLCPSGWHVPTDDEWTTLTNYLGGESIAGGKLKEAGTVHWKGLNYGTNESGFAALPGGDRWIDGSFNNFGGRGIWWSSTEDKSYNAYSRYIYSNDNSIVRSTGGNKFFGYSVRCLCDLLSSNKFELKGNNKIVLFPNPTKGQVNISFDKKLKGEFKVEIYNSLALLLQTKSISFNNGVAQIDLSTYSPGIYLISIDMKNNKFFGKVIKE